MIEMKKLVQRLEIAELMKTPIMFIVGDKEMGADSVSIRKRHKGDLGELEYRELMSKIKDEINRKGVFK